MKIETLLLVAACVSSVSFTVTTTSIFKWLRELVSPVHHKVEELIHCPWCLSHWVTFALLFLPGVDLYCFTEVKALNFFLTAFAITGISGLVHYVLLRAYEPVAKAMVERQLEKLRNS